MRWVSWQGKENEEEEEEECPFCVYMRAGPCGKNFSEWERCVEEAEESSTNIVEKCTAVIHHLKDCMEMHPEYYGPILQAEKAMEEEQQAAAAAAARERTNKQEPELRASIAQKATAGAPV
jgi:hypothetical protein